MLLKALTEHGVQILEVPVAHAVPKTERTVFHDGPYKFLPFLALPGNETPPTHWHGLACRGVHNEEGAAHHQKRRDVGHTSQPEHAVFALELASVLDGTRIQSFGRAIVMSREWEK